MYRSSEKLEAGQRRAMADLTAKDGASSDCYAPSFIWIQRLCTCSEGLYVWLSFNVYTQLLTLIVSTHDMERSHGPMAEYDARVESGRLRDDDHQRGTRPGIDGIAAS